MPVANDRGFRKASDARADHGFPSLKARIIARTGHHYYADKDDFLFDRLTRRFRSLGLADASAYARWLDGPDGEAEWSALEAEITIGETFFFRYAEQFAALRQTILPGLIALHERDRKLRIWSAGCSTGAEAYSIAILLDELLGPRLPEWDVMIVGTDISAAAVATARAGEYGRWALRTMAQEDRARWFRAIAPAPGPMREGGYRLRPDFRKMVRFERQNLLELVEGNSSDAYFAFDVILCRNVLIYFSMDVVLRVVRSFGTRLSQGGWLLLGHAEPNPAFAAWLQPVQLPGTVAYRRGDQALPTVDIPLQIQPLQRPVATPIVVELPVSVRVPAPEALLVPVVEPKSSVSSRIRDLANSGMTSEAWRMITEALEVDPTDPVLRFYEGLIALGLGRVGHAEQALRGALFLKRDFVMAHYHLGQILIGQGRLPAGRRALDNACKLAKASRLDHVLAEGDGVTAGELIESIRLTLGTRA